MRAEPLTAEMALAASSGGSRPRDAHDAGPSTPGRGGVGERTHGVRKACRGFFFSLCGKVGEDGQGQEAAQNEGLVLAVFHRPRVAGGHGRRVETVPRVRLP